MYEDNHDPIILQHQISCLNEIISQQQKMLQDAITMMSNDRLMLPRSKLVVGSTQSALSTQALTDPAVHELTRPSSPLYFLPLNSHTLASSTKKQTTHQNKQRTNQKDLYEVISI